MMLSLQNFHQYFLWSFVCFLSHTVSVSLFPFSWIISINVECNWYVTFLTLSRHNKNWKCAPCDKNCYKTIVSSFACNSLSVGYNTLLCDNFYYVKWTSVTSSIKTKENKHLVSLFTPAINITLCCHMYSVAQASKDMHFHFSTL